MLFQLGRGGRQLQEDEAAAAKDCSCPRGEHQILPGVLLIIIWRALGCKLRITMIWFKTTHFAFIHENYINYFQVQNSVTLIFIKWLKKV